MGNPDLSWRINKLIEILGEDPALRLLEDHGGTEVWFNSCGLPRDSVTALVDVFGQSCTLPKRDQISRIHRNAEIIRRRKSGEKIKSLALAFDLTQATIYAILSRTTAPQSVGGGSTGVIPGVLTVFDEHSTTEPDDDSRGDQG